MFKKTTALLISGALAVSIFLPFGGGSYAKASINNDVTEEIDFGTVIEKPVLTPIDDQSPIEINGVKSKAVVKVAQLLKAGGDEVIDAAKLFNIIDDDVAKVLKKNSAKIGNYLDSFANAGDDAANMVRKQLPIWLNNNTSMSKGVAENISIALSWAIRGADWLFF